MNSSAGVYDEAFAQGVIDIHYYPSGKKIPGAVDEGTAVVKIYGQIYAAERRLHPSQFRHQSLTAMIPESGGRPSGCRAFLAEPPTDCLQ